jgi:hypothetical protein
LTISELRQGGAQLEYRSLTFTCLQVDDERGVISGDFEDCDIDEQMADNGGNRGSRFSSIRCTRFQLRHRGMMVACCVDGFGWFIE